MKNPLLTTVFLLAALFCFAQSGSITNMSVAQRTDGTGLVDIHFDLDGPVNSYYMNLEVSFNAGANYFVIRGIYLSGDVGPISPGTNKHIVWDGMQSHPNRYSNETMLMIIATSAGSINPCPNAPTVTDIDGNVYNTELIGQQCWMKENLRVTHYRDGEEIHGMSWYDNDISWKYIYGGLYSWWTAVNTKGLCPEGWNLPSNVEWNILTNHITGGSANGGRQLKSCRQIDSPLGGNCNTNIHPRWDNSGHYGTDEYGFSALPSGRYESWGAFTSLGSGSFFWSTDTYSTYAVWSWEIVFNSNTFSNIAVSRTNLYSVRCIKD